MATSRIIGITGILAVFVVAAVLQDGAAAQPTGNLPPHSARAGATSPNAAKPTNALYPTVTADGRYIAFQSDDPTLIPGDTNGATDIFVRDTLTGTIKRVSVSTTGKQGNGPSVKPAISANGRFVVFETAAKNLIPSDSNAARDVLLKDLITGSTSLISANTHGAVANAGSYWPQISGDGRIIAFESDATDLVAGDTNGQRDVFVRNRETKTTTRISIAEDGRQATRSSSEAQISRAGDVVTFNGMDETLDSSAPPCDHTWNECFTSNTYVRDLIDGTLRRVKEFDVSRALPMEYLLGSGPVLSGNGTTLSAITGRGADAIGWGAKAVSASLEDPAPSQAGYSANDNFPTSDSRVTGYGTNYSATVSTIIWESGDRTQSLYLYRQGTSFATLALGFFGGFPDPQIQSELPSTLVAMSRSGAIVAFATMDALVPQDVDGGAVDIYWWDSSANRLLLVS